MNSCGGVCCGSKGAGGRLPFTRRRWKGAAVDGGERNKDGPIRVLLADDHTMFRQGLAAVLASHGALEVVAEVPNDEDALRLARELSPDVVVMQVQMPFERRRRPSRRCAPSPSRPR
jgi:hypothetical protein